MARYPDDRLTWRSMPEEKSPPNARLENESGAGRVAGPELEIKDAPLIFERVWKQLVQERGLEGMAFPKEIMWLGGAPGSGKGTNTPFILRERGLTAPPIVVSDLLDTPEMRALKDRGQLIGDRQVVEALLRELLKPEYQTGVVVDGFPRTKVQAATVKLLHDQMIKLRSHRKEENEMPRLPHRHLFGNFCHGFRGGLGEDFEHIAIYKIVPEKKTPSSILAESRAVQDDAQRGFFKPALRIRVGIFFIRFSSWYLRAASNIAARFCS